MKLTLAVSWLLSLFSSSLASLYVDLPQAISLSLLRGCCMSST